MGFFNEFPHTRTYDNDLGWLIKTIKDIQTQLDNFIKINTIKYADPIIWNITTQYEANTVVIDGNTGTAYLSTQPVPSGVALNNTDYWTTIFTLNLLSANQNITFRDDGTNVVSSFASEEGDWLIWNFNLYRVSQDIPLNTAYVVGYNLVRYSVELFIKDYIAALYDYVGDLDDLDTTDKTSIVNAINSLLSDIDDKIDDVNDKIGDLDDLDTTDKTSIVNAINETLVEAGKSVIGTPEMFGAVGDGITDDTAAIQDAINSGYNILLFTKTYKVTSQITLKSNLTIISKGGVILDNSDHLLPYEGVFNADGINDLTIDSLTFNGVNSSGTVQYTSIQVDSLINIKNSTNITISNCTINGTDKSNCIVTQACNKVLIDNNTINYYVYCAIGFYDTTNNAIARNNKINNCRFVPLDQNNSYGIVLSGYTSTTYSVGNHLRATGNILINDTHMWEGIDSHGGVDVEIDNNYIEGYQMGITAMSNPNNTPSFYISKLNIHDNRLEGYVGTNGFNTPSGCFGITASGYGLIIANNYINNYGRYIGPNDIRAYAAIRIFLQSSGFKITNNVIDRQGGCGIIFEVSSLAVDGVIDNNVIGIYYDAGGARYSIYMYDAASYGALSINNNQFLSSSNMRYTGTLPTGGIVTLNGNDYTHSNAPNQTNISNVIPDICKTTEIGTLLRGIVGKVVRCQDATTAGAKLYVCTSASPVTYDAIS